MKGLTILLVASMTTVGFAKERGVMGGTQPSYKTVLKSPFDPKNQTPGREFRTPASDPILKVPYQPRVWCHTASLKSKDLAETMWRQYFGQIDVLDTGSITPQELMVQVFIAAEENGLSKKVTEIDWDDLKEHLRKSVADQVVPILSEENKGTPSTKVARTVLNLLCARTIASSRRY